MHYQRGRQGCDYHRRSEAALRINPAPQQIPRIPRKRKSRGLRHHHRGSFQPLGARTHDEIDVGRGGEAAEQSVQDGDDDRARWSLREEHDRSLQNSDDCSPPQQARKRRAQAQVTVKQSRWQKEQRLQRRESPEQLARNSHILRQVIEHRRAPSRTEVPQEINNRGGPQRSMTKKALQRSESFFIAAKDTLEFARRFESPKSLERNHQRHAARYQEGAAHGSMRDQPSSSQR